MIEWQGSQHNGVERAEDGRGRAEAERQRQDRHEREAARAQQLADAECHVLGQLRSELRAALAVIPFPRQGATLRAERVDVAKPSVRLGARLMLGHALPHEIACGHIEVEGNVGLHLVLGAGTPEVPARHARSGGEGETRSR